MNVSQNMGESRQSRDVFRKEFSNETDLSLPSHLTDLIKKGRNFRIPPVLLILKSYTSVGLSSAPEIDYFAFENKIRSLMH